MDQQSFDAFTRQFTTGLPRRGTLALLVGSVSSLLVNGALPVEAGCKKVGKKCDKNKDCCDGAKCKKDTCKCKSGWDECNGNGKCQKLDNDPTNCGACGNACLAGATCSDGTCVAPLEQCVPLTPVFDRPPAPCGSSAECCNGGTCCTFREIDGPYTGCYDLLSHTTACGHSCEAIVNCLNTDQICVNGQCVDP